MASEHLLEVNSIFLIMLLLGITMSNLLADIQKINARVLAMSDCAIEAIDLSFMGKPINFTTCYLGKVPLYEKHLNESLKKYGWSTVEELG